MTNQKKKKNGYPVQNIIFFKKRRKTEMNKVMNKKLKTREREKKLKHQNK